MPSPTPSHPPVLMWFRRDLRLADNPALLAALDAGPVVPVYIWSPDGPARPIGGAGRWWLHHSLARLADDLEKKGSKLILRAGAPASELSALAQETSASALFYNRLYDPEEADLAKEIAQTGSDGGFEVRDFTADLLVEPGALATKSGGLFQVFTPFWRAFQEVVDPPQPHAPPTRLKAPKAFPKSEPLESFALLPKNPDWAGGFDGWSPGEAGAEKALEVFATGGLRGYGVGRDRPDQPSISRLSPHLHWGEVSAAHVWRRVAGAGERREAPRADVEVYHRELAWRDFNHHLLAARPDLLTNNFKPAFDAFPWRKDAKNLKAWRRGQTGYPIVDAGMRQLWSSGFMHNRVRMIVASFLIKDLLIDWREGEKWFWDTLVDANLANNVLNWQWVAGSGVDASPFFRIFNPVSQGQRFDPEGAYVKKWVPELRALPKDLVHAPFEAPPLALVEAGVVLGRTYPHPVVDHNAARKRALAAFALTKAPT